jgi:site-specific recombinase XerD
LVKNKAIHEKHLIKTINQNLKRTCKINQISYNIKSNSFRINMITQLLKHPFVQNAADIIGHKDIKATMAYKKYPLNKEEIQKLLNKID